MTHKILHIDSAITADNSVSRSLTQSIVDHLQNSHDDTSIAYRDLATAEFDQINGPWLAAVNTPVADRSTDQSDTANLSDQLINEVKEADTLVIGLPVYNFAAPSQLKAWIDQIARAGVTFAYGENGPEGLIKNTRAIIAYTAGGTPFGSDMDFASGYLRHVLGFIGITDVQFVVADKGAIDADASLKQAQEHIAALAA
jgi:FMN-dependent NADH-azoreductase